MLDVPILGQVALGYSPFIDRNRAVSATRLTVKEYQPREREFSLALDEIQAVHTVVGSREQ